MHLLDWSRTPPADAFRGRSGPPDWLLGPPGPSGVTLPEVLPSSRSALPSRGRWPSILARQAARSIARMAVSGWLIGSTPTRLTIDVIVPSASASTHAARCSSPR